MSTTPIAFPAASSGFQAEKDLINGAYELLRSLENEGIVDPREAGICLNLCQTYNNALANGGIPDQGFVASKPFAIMKHLSLAITENGKPNHAAINQAITIAFQALNFVVMQQPRPQTASVQ